MALTESELEGIFEEVALVPAGRALVREIATGNPARRVQGNNAVTGRFASRKMSAVIQYESRTLEGAACTLYEADPSVVAYWDQPYTFELPIRRPGTARNLTRHTPDFFVIRKGAGGWELRFEEWRDRARMAKLAESDPGRWVLTESGWTQPAMSAALEPLGLGYVLRHEDALPAMVVKNEQLLAPVRVAHHYGPGVAESAVSAVRSNPGCTLSELLTHTRIEVDDAFALIAEGRIWTDLRAALLSDHDRVRLWPDDTLAGADAPAVAVERGELVLAIGARLRWAGTTYEICEKDDRGVFVQSVDITPVRTRKIDHATLAEWIKSGDITGVGNGHSGLSDALARVRWETVEQANERETALAAFIASGVTPTDRTRRRWLASYRAAASLHGEGKIGLLARTAKCGNRVPRLQERSEELARTTIETKLMTPEQRSVKTVFAMYLLECVDAGVPPMGKSVFYERVAALGKSKRVRAQWGKKAGNGAAMRTPLSGLGTSGLRAFGRVHVDHTLLDVDLVDSKTGELLGRPWLSIARDAKTGRVLAKVLLNDAPSARSCQLVARDMVRRFSRLPETLVVDHGKEFGSEYFETLLAAYGVNLERRPAGNPRYGSEVEGMFAKLNRDLIWNLVGNTKIRRNVRAMSPSADPGQRAIWTLGELDAELERYIAWMDDQPNQRLGGTPREFFDASIAESGSSPTRLISYDLAFRALSAFQTARNGSLATVHRLGVTINRINYWNEAFRAPGVEGTRVEVRYEPLNGAIAYARIKGEWHQLATSAREFEGLTERELASATRELRTRLRRGPDPLELAAYLREVEAREAELGADKDEALRARRAREQRLLLTEESEIATEDVPASQPPPALDPTNIVKLSGFTRRPEASA